MNVNVNDNVIDNDNVNDNGDYQLGLRKVNFQYSLYTVCAEVELVLDQDKGKGQIIVRD